MTYIRVHIAPGTYVSFLKSKPIDDLVLETQRFFRHIKRLADPPDTIPDERLLSYARHTLIGLKRRYEGLDSLAKALKGDTESVYLSYRNYVEKHLNNLN
jgi:hypothetical protein